MIKLIHNSGLDKHEKLVNKSFKESDEITMAVAFVKMSGIRMIRDNLNTAVKEGKRITLITGIDYGQTEPEALEFLLELFSGSNCRLLLADSETATFHPKIYLFKTESQAKAFIGSANLTGGGLNNNCECSLYLELPLESIEMNYLSTFIDGLADSSMAVTQEIIDKYREFYKKQRPARIKIKASPKSEALDNRIELDGFRKYYELKGDQDYRSFVEE